MKNSFVNRYKSKPSGELAQILVSNKHHPEAKNAAQNILIQREEHELIESSKANFDKLSLAELLDNLKSYGFDYKIESDSLKISRNENRILRGRLLMALGILSFGYVLYSWLNGITSWELRYPITSSITLPLLGWIDSRSPKYTMVKIHPKGIDLKKADTENKTVQHFSKKDSPEFISKPGSKEVSILIRSDQPKNRKILQLRCKSYESTQDFTKALVQGLNSFFSTLGNIT